ncbi:MAG TPA: GNAT family N-acetyltransferase [Ktedonobacteraceae bacterium]
MSQEDVIIRNVCREDSQAIATILRSLEDWSEAIQNELPAQTQAHVAERIEQCLKESNHTILVAERRSDPPADRATNLDAPVQASKTVIGYVAVHWFPHLLRGSDGYVSELFLLPKETGHGIGGHLLDAVYRAALERNCTQLILMNRRIRESYRRHFYAQHGWEEQPDAAFFSLTLSTPPSPETQDGHVQCADCASHVASVESQTQEQWSLLPA